MANVKFNQGLLSQASSNDDNALGFLAQDTTAKEDRNFGYLYLGKQLVATKYLKELDTTGLTVASSSADKILGFGWDSTNSKSVMNTITLTKAAGVSAQGYTPSDTDMMTASAVASYVSTQIGANDTYHGTGDWDSTTWNKYVAKYYRGDTEVTSSATGYHALEFTLPVASSTASSSDWTTPVDNKLVTPAGVVNYVAGLAGGMRYIGALATNSIPASSKPGDTFIASTTFVVGTSPNQRTIEEGDMIVLNSNYTSGNLAYADSKWNFDMFERNVDGTLVKSTSAFTQYGVSYVENTTGIIASTSAGAQGTLLIGKGSAAPAWLSVGTSGQILSTQGANADPAWADYVFYTIAAGSTANVLDITKYKNGNVDTTYGTSGTGTLSITINDVAHATNADKVNQTVSTTNADKPLLIGAGGTSGDPQDVNYSAKISANAGSGLITASEIKLGASGSQINVYETLTWQTLS